MIDIPTKEGKTIVDTLQNNSARDIAVRVALARFCRE
jgi:hypothetical protein